MPYRYNLIERNKPSCKIFLEICPDFTIDRELSPVVYMKKYWNLYLRTDKQSNSMNGAIFELLFYTLLVNKKIVPFYTQSNVTLVPNVRYDILLYTNKGNFIGLSLKTSLRERYKQADLEAYVLKNVHRKSKTYIVTAEENEALNVNQKINNGELLALNHVYTLQNLDQLIDELSEYEYIRAENIPLITGRAIDTI